MNAETYVNGNASGDINGDDDKDNNLNGFIVAAAVELLFIYFVSIQYIIYYRRLYISNRIILCINKIK